MSLVQHAESELKRAGLFDADSDYNGGLGSNALAIIKLFAEQGHSGHSAEITTRIVTKLMRYELLTPLENPTITGDFRNCGQPGGSDCDHTWQSLRDSSVFSDDSGKTWYHLKKYRKWWQHGLAWVNNHTPLPIPFRWIRGRVF